jgi:hypothetical protein
MQTIELLRPAASQPGYCLPPAAKAMNRGPEDPIESGFLATLLAAGHDLRQPLQLIRRPDVLATMLRGKGQREELARAGMPPGNWRGC